MFEVWSQMSDTNIDMENPSDLPALISHTWPRIPIVTNPSTSIVHLLLNFSDEMATHHNMHQYR